MTIDDSPTIFAPHPPISFSNPLSDVPPNLLIFLCMRVPAEGALSCLLTAQELVWKVSTLLNPGVPQIVQQIIHVSPFFLSSFLLFFFFFFPPFIILFFRRRKNCLIPPLAFLVQQGCIATHPNLLTGHFVPHCNLTLIVAKLFDFSHAHWYHHLHTPLTTNRLPTWEGNNTKEKQTRQKHNKKAQRTHTYQRRLGSTHGIWQHSHTTTKPSILINQNLALIPKL